MHEEEPGSQLKLEKLRAIIAKTGFSEDAVLVQLRDQIRDAQTTEQFKQVLTDYQLKAEQAIDGLDNMIRARAQIGLILTQATVYLEKGLQDEFAENLDQAREYAFQMYFDELVDGIDQLP